MVHLWLYTKQGAIKKKCIFVSTWRPHKQNSEYLEKYLWSSTHANDLEKGIILWDIWFLCGCDN